MKRIDRAKLRYRLMVTHWYMTGVDDPLKMIVWDVRLAQNGRMRLKASAWRMYSREARRHADEINNQRFERELREAMG